MKPSLHLQIRLMSGFGRFKPGLTVAHSVGHDLHKPLTLMFANTQKPTLIGFSGFSHVLKIARPRHLAQVAKTIVAFVAVYVVDMLRRPFTRDIRPRKAMRELLSVANGYSPIARRLRRTCYFPLKIGSCFMLGPNEKSRVGVVTKRRSQMLDSAWWLGCHDNRFTIEDCV